MSTQPEQEGNERSYFERQMYYTLRRLTRVTRYIEVISSICFLLLISALLLIALLFLRKSNFPITLNQYDIIFLSTGVFIINILCLLLYQRFHRVGEVLFAELSDELQWHLTEANSAQLNAPPYGDRSEFPSDRAGRPPIAIRIALRSYIKNTGLPLVDGTGGTQIYFGVSVTLWIVSIAMSLIGR